MKDINFRLYRVVNACIVLIMLAGFMLVGCVQATPTAEEPPPPEPMTLTVPPSEEVSTMESQATATSIPALSPEVQPTVASFETQPSKQVTITGWFTTIWNDEPLYSITDDQGQTTQLLLDDETAKPLGGPLELDRKRVTIVGEIISDSPRTVRVLSVQFANTD